MKIKEIAIFTLSLILVFSFGCNKKVTPSKPEIPNKPEDTAPIETIDLIKEKLNSMSMDEKIGQLVLAGVDDYTNNEHSKALINDYRVGGFILLGQNVKSTDQMLTLINSLKETNSANNGIPLFLGVDEEGGRVTRMPAEFVKFPTNKIIGGINNSSFSYEIGGILGEELKAFGFNIDFAPVLDVNSNPKNPVIGDRSFGPNANIVSELGVKTMEGIQDQNIISSVKHFPGHGDTSVDSHVGLPVVNNDMDRLNSLELIPFAKAIKNGVDMVMVAHILLPKIDASNPASFSKTIITDILRKNLNFNGVVITDDMTMGAIIKNYDIGEVAVKSLKAGSDIVLVCHDFDKETAVLKAIKTAVESGELSQQDVDEKVYRILKLKEKYKLIDTTVASVNVQEINNKITKLLNAYIKH